LRQALLKRYELTADNFRPRDNWLVAELLALLHTLLSKLEAGQALTFEEQLPLPTSKLWPQRQEPSRLRPQGPALAVVRRAVVSATGKR